MLFLGLGLTFLILSFLRTGQGRIKWAIYPAIILLAFGIVLSFTGTPLWNYVWPALIIVAGLYFLLTAFFRR